MSLHRRLLIVPLLLLAPLAGAAHVTDKLVVGVYAGPEAEGTPLRLIASGTPLEVIGRDGVFSEVRLADDTRGWIESTYITDEKPAKAILLETQAKLRRMGMEVAALREKAGDGAAQADPADAAPPGAREARLRDSLQQAEQRIAELEQALAGAPNQQAAQAQLDDLRARTGEALRLLAEAQGIELGEPLAGVAAPGPLRRYAAWIIAVVAVGIGFAAGVAFIDYRIRKRYGGFRI